MSRHPERQPGIEAECCIPEERRDADDAANVFRDCVTRNFVEDRA